MTKVSWDIEPFSHDCQKTETKAIIILTPTNHKESKQQNEPITIPSNNTCNSLKAQEKSHVHDAIGFGVASH